MLQNFLICIEMFLAAIAHKYSFSHQPYKEGILQHQSLCETLMAMWDLRDVHDNIREHFTVVGKYNLAHKCNFIYTLTIHVLS